MKSNILCCKVDDLQTIFVCVYHPYWGNSAEHVLFLDHIQQIFDTLSSPNYQLVLCGDVNGLSNKLSSFFLCNKLSQLIDFPTRVNNTIDIFATTNPQLFLQPQNLSSLGRSDHSGFFISTIRSHHSASVPRKVVTRDYRSKNHYTFLSFLININWDDLLLGSSIDDSISLS